MKDVKKSTFLGIMRYLKRRKFSLVFVILSAVLQVLFTLLIPYLAGKGIDCILSEGNVDFASLTKFLIAILCCTVGAAISQWILNVLSQKISYAVLSDARVDAFDKIQTLPLKFLDGTASGSVAGAVISDAEQFADGLLLGFTQLFTGIATILGLIVVLFVLRWEIALVVLCITPLSLVSAKFISSRSYKMFRAQSLSRAEQTAYIDEEIGNLKLVKAFSREGACGERFEELNKELNEISLKAVFFSSITNPVTRFLNALVYALVALTGAMLVLGTGGTFSVGSFGSVLSYCTQYTKPFNEITETIAEFQNSLACAARLFALTNEESESSDEGAEVLKEPQGAISLTHVDFSYEKEKPLIEDLNVEVKAGEKVAIVGPTGCGKTTLINLLMRFYDVDGGRISIDGKDLRTITRRSLRENIGMVLQETWLKSATVRENIRMGKPNASDEEVTEACKAAHAHNFILQLPEGYDTVLSESGSLSQGQRQLLCIARVMLLKPPMLILDEATSNIDTRTERKVQDAFEKLMEGRTSFIVAHRLSTIENADLILVMKAGKIVEQGTHLDLLSRRGFYYELYHARF